MESQWLSPAEQEDSALTMTGSGLVSINRLAIGSISPVTLMLSPTLCGSAGRPVQLWEVGLSTLGQGGFRFGPSETPLEGIQIQSGELGMGRNGEEEWGEKGRRG